MKAEIAVLGGGCFWCLEAAYLRVKGVVNVTSGYAGGEEVDPTYQAVSHGETGHAEVVLIEFDAEIIDYRTILEIFFTIHDPSTLNRQSNDIGAQYRSAIFYASSEQKAIATQLIESLLESGTWAKITTQVVPLEAFYEAEEYHQRYYEKNPDQAYCQLVINPKLSKLRANHADLLTE